MASVHHFHIKIWKNLLAAGLLCFLFLPLSSHAFFGGKTENFSADQVTLSPDGRIVNTLKIYAAPKAYRVDGVPGGGMQGAPKADLTILGYKKGNMQYIFNHDKKIYFESELDEKAMALEMEKYKNVKSEQVLGKENVSGYPCVKKKVTAATDIMGMSSADTVILWESNKFDFPLRIQNEDGQITEFRNIDTGKPDKKLFRRLPGYRKVNNMMEAMGMDFASMAKKKNASGNDKQPSSSKNIEDANPEEIMTGLKQAMGENADPEQMEQMQQAMAHALSRAKQLDYNPGAADGLWRIIPKRDGDKIANEMKFPNVYNVTMGTQASLEQICSFYEQKLKADGWKNSGKHIQNGQGFLNMTKGRQQLMISSAENPGLPGNFKLFYILKLHSPDI